MTTVAWSDWHPLLAPWVRGCPYPMMDQEVQAAADEFCRRTRVWCEWLEPTVTAANLREYDLEIPTGADVVRIEKATIGDAAASVVAYRDAARDPQEYPIGVAAVASPERKTFWLGADYPAALELRIQVSLTPSRAATGAPEILWTHYAKPIAAGARSALLLMPNTEWFQPALGAAARAEFDSAIAAASVEAWRGHTGATPRACVKWF